MIDDAAVALCLALAIDLALGEPPNAVHPVAWMGKLASALTSRAPRRGRVRQLAAGLAIAIAVPVVFASAAASLLSHVARWPIVELAVMALVLKPTFALRALGRAALVVRDALVVNDLAAARGALCSLCSRDPAQLDEPRVVAATVESVAENASDSFVAPLFYFVLFGVPGAVAYRAINTLDAMIGYRGRYEYLGKAAARLDDVANLVPARITALLLLVAGALCRCDVRGGWRVLRRDGGATQSPNAGRPMAAMAGLLGVELEKVGHYCLGDAREPLVAETITTAWRIVRVAGLLAVLLTFGALHV